MPASAGVSRTTETKRAASSEWPPRSVKKSASNGDRLVAEARAWPRRAAPPRSRCAASPARRGASPTAGRSLQRLAVDLAGGRGAAARRRSRNAPAPCRAAARRAASARSVAPVDRRRPARARGRRRAGRCRRPGAAPPRPGRCPAAAASFVSISPSSTRKPRILTWSSMRPWKTMLPVVVDADRVAGAVEDRVAPVRGERVGDELLGRQLGPA